jgi:hypothetical protein
LEEKMDNKKILDQRLSLIGWALLLIWWGLRWSVLISLPEGSGFLGTSLILLGVNAVRLSAGIPARKDTTFFGLLTLLAGGTLFTFAVLHTSFQPPVFETTLIVLGVLLLAYALFGARKSTLSEPE